MSAVDAFLLTLTLAALAALPSASVALVVARAGSSLGAGLAASAGIVVGDLLFVGLALAGMAALAASLGSYFVTVKYLAALLLIAFGISLWRNARADERSPARIGWAGSFATGLLLTLADLKAIVFYASLLPVFVDLDTLAKPDIAGVLAITLLTVGGTKAAYALAAHHWLRRLPDKANLTARRVAGTLMLGAGVVILTRELDKYLHEPS